MNTNQTMVKMTLDRWYAQVGNTDKLLAFLTDEQLQQEISPGKNRGIYLLGHLIAVHDAMMPLLDFGDKVYPELAGPFFTAPDKTVSNIPSAAALRATWSKQNEAFSRQLERLQADQWFERHTSVSDEDFMKEPHRNKLNIIVTRTSHLSYHLGQLVLLKR